MSNLLRKELRLLLPAWIAALAAATVPLWSGADAYDLGMPCFVLAVCFLSLAPFGQEISWGTFGLLLSQPENRRVFWRIKIELLTLALLSAWGLFFLCWQIGGYNLDPWNYIGLGPFDDVVLVSGLLALLAFSSGLWTILLLRDVTTAFFATLIVPTALCAATLLALSRFHNILIGPPFLAVMAAYSVAGYLVARRLFLGAEDVPLAWTGRQISLPKVRGWPLRRLACGFQKKRGPWSALIIKELQLQEITMVVVPLIALLHLASLAARHFAPDWSARTLIFDFPVFALWLVAPLVVGCVAVAEERRYNTLESLLCLPMRKRSQFAVKLAVVLALGTVLGGVVPWILEYYGAGKVSPARLEPSVSFVAAAAAIAAISFFASTLSRGILQGFTVALLLLMGWVTTIQVLIGRSGGFGTNQAVFLYGGALFEALALPALIATFLWLSFRNFISLQTGWRLWAGNVIRFAAVFAAVVLIANAIFDRSWECLMPLEPPHGPARLSGPGRARIASLGSVGICVLLPDGRLWAGKLDPTGKNLSGHFAGGSNWVDLAGCFFYGSAASLKSDGTLWRFSVSGALRQVGTDSDWKKVVAGTFLFLALKQDGTIWGWGNDEFGILSTDSGEHGRGMAFPDPVRVRPESDWVDVFVPSDYGQAVAVKRDGSLWEWGNNVTGMNGRIHTFSDYHQLARLSMAGTNWSSLAGGYVDPILGVRTDGSLWAGAGDFSRFWWPSGREVSLFGSRISIDDLAKSACIGTKTDWVSVSLGGSAFLALEADGTLWAVERRSLETKRPSKYHDWLAATGSAGRDWAVAKDGTICCWGDFSRRVAYEERTDRWIVLRPSRRPLASLNILDTN